MPTIKTPHKIKPSSKNKSTSQNGYLLSLPNKLKR